MRALAELIHPEDAGAEEVRRLLAHAVNPVEVIRGDRARGERALLRAQEDTSTALGAGSSCARIGMSKSASVSR